ncbi:unnamed protein product, partial [Effrenium voratum]
SEPGWRQAAGGLGAPGHPMAGRRRLAAVLVLLGVFRGLQRAFTAPEGTPAPCRREVMLPLLGSAILADPALADSSVDIIVGDSRKKATYEAREGGFLGANKFKKQTSEYNYTDLQSFLPKLYMARRSFEMQLKQLNDKKVDVNNPETYAKLRQINRDEPVKRLRKELFRTQQWVKYTSGDFSVADTEYDRVRRALDEEDSQCLLMSRFEDKVPTASVRSARRSIQAILDSIDDLLALVPQKEQEAARAVAETRKVPGAKLPYKVKKPPNATNATVAPSPEPSPSNTSSPSGGAGLNLGNASSIPFGSMAMDTFS